MSPFWILLQLRMMEVMVTTEAIRPAKLQSNQHHHQTDIQLFFYRPDALPVAQPTVSSTEGKSQIMLECSFEMLCDTLSVYVILFFTADS